MRKVIRGLEPYFRKYRLKVQVTSGYRSPEHQLELIKKKAIKYGLDKKYPSLRTATVGDVESWRGAWDELLNVKGYIINPPVAARSFLGERKGRTIPPSAHISKKAFDLSTGRAQDLERIAAIVRAYKKATGRRGIYIKVEKVNNAVHIGLP
jgi:hypothetical protein